MIYNPKVSLQKKCIELEKLIGTYMPFQKNLSRKTHILPVLLRPEKFLDLFILNFFITLFLYKISLLIT